MLIRYKSTSCGPQGSFQPGDVREVDAREGEALVRGGYAEDVTPRVREQAVVAPVERAVGVGNPFPVQPLERTDAAPAAPSRNVSKRGR